MVVLTRDYGNDDDYQVYSDAIRFARDERRFSLCGVDEADWPLWWAAWFAARCTAISLLAEAYRMGLSDEQRERLRVVAARVATD